MINKLKGILNKDKRTSNLVLIVILLAVVLIATSYIFEEDNEIETLMSASSSNVDFEMTDNIETKLAYIISKIKGVETADVMISYSRAEKIIPVYDVKEDVDSIKENNRESTKTTTEKTVAYESKDGSKVAMVESKETAEALGAIVVVTGNITNSVEGEIKQAVSYATNIPIHKIQIFVN